MAEGIKELIISSFFSYLESTVAELMTLLFAEYHMRSQCGPFKCHHANRIMEQDVVTGATSLNFDSN